VSSQTSCAIAEGSRSGDYDHYSLRRFGHRDWIQVMDTIILVVGLGSGLVYFGLALVYAYMLVTTDEFDEPYDDEL